MNYDVIIEEETSGICSVDAPLLSQIKVFCQLFTSHLTIPYEVTRESDAQKLEHFIAQETS